jgi:hypothetical protein
MFRPEKDFEKSQIPLPLKAPILTPKWPPLSPRIGILLNFSGTKPIL